VMLGLKPKERNTHLLKYQHLFYKKWKKLLRNIWVKKLLRL
jgi:hypothetical protein